MLCSSYYIMTGQLSDYCHYLWKGDCWKWGRTCQQFGHRLFQIWCNFVGNPTSVTEQMLKKPVLLLIGSYNLNWTGNGQVRIIMGMQFSSESIGNCQNMCFQLKCERKMKDVRWYGRMSIAWLYVGAIIY